MPTPPARPDTWWAELPSAAAISELLDHAGRGADGVLEFSSDPGGAVYLSAGAVSQVVCPAVPHVAARVLRRVEPERRGEGEPRNARARAEVALRERVLPRVQVHALLMDAAADAGLDLVAHASATRFESGPQHWAPLVWPLPVSDLLAEIARRRRVLASVERLTRPDEPVRRAEGLPARRIRLTPRQWDLVRLAGGTRTPRAMAHELGFGVFATTLEVAALVGAGVLAPRHPTVGSTPLPFLRAVNAVNPVNAVNT